MISFCFMSDHMHILLRVPGDTEKEISDTVLLQRIGCLYGEKIKKRLKKRWTVPPDTQPSQKIEDEKDAFRIRMNDLGEFMKTLKQRITQSYNKRNDREGTLWESRFYSILLEPTQHVLSVVSAYIDLNPVRAHMVNNPAAYRFSSYGEACTGTTIAQEGLCRIYKHRNECPSWKTVKKLYCDLLLKKEPSIKRSTPNNTIQNALNIQCPLTELLENKVRMFSKGISLGCATFMENIKQLVKKGIHQITFPPSAPS